MQASVCTENVNNVRINLGPCFHISHSLVYTVWRCIHKHSFFLFFRQWKLPVYFLRCPRSVQCQAAVWQTPSTCKAPWRSGPDAALTGQMISDYLETSVDFKFISDDLPGQMKDFSDFTGVEGWTDRTRVDAWTTTQVREKPCLESPLGALLFLGAGWRPNKKPPPPYRLQRLTLCMTSHTEREPLQSSGLALRCPIGHGSLAMSLLVQMTWKRWPLSSCASRWQRQRCVKGRGPPWVTGRRGFPTHRFPTPTWWVWSRAGWPLMGCPGFGSQGPRPPAVSP